MSDHDERVGLVVAGRYRIDRVLGVGGMGGVYEAEHLLIGKKVALKCLHREYARDRDVVERFKREARAATLIGNEHIIDVTDMGDLPDGAPFLVMEFLVGRPLDALLEIGPLPIKRAVRIARQICSALGAAHDKGIVHRDLKPENCFLIERNGDPDFVKVLDFGISKMHSSGVDKGLTRTGVAMGTPSYMSPEQAQGSKHVDHRTDVWALGVMLYEMLTARRPFDADSYPMLLMSIVATDPEPVDAFRKDLPPGLASIVMRCLEKDPEARVGSMRELSEALAPFEQFDAEIRLVDSPAPGGRSGNVTDKLRQTALARKKTPLPSGSVEDRSEPAQSGLTRPDGSRDAPVSSPPGPASVDARQALPSQAERSSARVPSETAPEVRAFEQKVRGFQPRVLGVAVGLVLVVGVGLAVSSGAIGGGSREPSSGAASSSGDPEPTARAGSEPREPPATHDRDESPPAASPPSDPPQVPPAPSAVPATPPAEVRIRIRVEPSDARIFIGGVEFPNPMDAPQPRSLTPTRITVQREGYRTIEQLAVFAEDQSFVFQMARGRGVEQRGLGASAAGGSSSSSVDPVDQGVSRMTSATMEIYQGMQGGFREEW